MRSYPIVILSALLLGACASDEASAVDSPKLPDSSVERFPKRAPEEPFRFRLEFVTMSETEGAILIGDRTVVASGAPLRIVLERLGAGRVYLIHRDPDDAIAVLYPRKDQLAQQKRKVRILSRELGTKTGTETYHLIASEEPLEQLERAIANVHNGKEGAASALRAEVLALRKRHESMAEKAWRPASIGGQVRGDPDALEYSVRGALCRTYTIDHR